MMMPSMMPPMMWSMQQMYAQQFVYQQQQQQQHFHQQQMMLQHQQAQTFLERQEQQQHQEEFGEDVDVDEETLAQFMQSSTIAEENNALNATSWTIADQETATQHPSSSTYASHHNPSFAAPMQQHSTEYTFEQDNPYAEHDEDVPLSALFEQGMRYYYSGHLQTAILSFEAILQRRKSATFVFFSVVCYCCR